MIRYASTYISIAIEYNFHRSQFARFRVPMQQDEIMFAMGRCAGLVKCVLQLNNGRIKHDEHHEREIEISKK